MTGEGVRCVEMVEIITDWLEGALSEQESAEVEEHLGICPHCVDYVGHMRTTTSLLGHLLDDERPSEAVRRRLLEALHHQRSG